MIATCSGTNVLSTFKDACGAAWTTKLTNGGTCLS